MKKRIEEQALEKIEFNGYDFDDEKTRKKMKYLVIKSGDLDLNGAYAFKSKKELKDYLEDCYRKIYAVFEIKDITKLFDIKLK